MKLTNKVAIVTGAASGIGAEIVRLYLEAEACIVAVDVDPALAAQAEKWSAAHTGRVDHGIGDVALERTAAEFTSAAARAFGGIDVMVNNAGIACSKPIADHSEAEWDRIMNVNVKSMFWSAKYVVLEMRRRGGGLFLNTGSISSVVGIPLQGAYGPSKGAVIQLTRQMAIEYAAENIRVNAVCPGTVETPLVRKAAGESGDAARFMSELEAGHPVGRIASAEEIAQFYLFLASDHARFITGAILMIDGGFTAR